MIATVPDYAAVLFWTSVGIAIWSTIASLELVAVARAFHPGRPLGTDLAVLVRGRAIPRLLMSSLASPPALLVAPLLRLAAGLALPFLAAGGAAVALVAVLATTALLSLVKGGSDGADKIALVAALAALAIATGLVLGDAWLCLAGVVWGAGQAVIAYGTSGVAKLVRPFWRDGSALAAAMTSYRSGHRLAAAVVRYRGAALALAWGVMLVEALFPLALVAPPLVCAVILGVLAVFHGATAVVMGLNTYPWAFIATYPCVMAANVIVRGAGIGMG